MARFIAVFRPHQRPAWAEWYSSEDEFLALYRNRVFARLCFAEPLPDESPDFDAAWEDVGHDLSRLTRLDSAEEVEHYLAHEQGHNSGRSAVAACAREIGWCTDDEEEEEEE